MKSVLHTSVNSLYFFAFALFCTTIMGCLTGGDVEVDFKMNGRDIRPSNEEPTENEDGNAMLQVQVGDTIKLWDVSEPRDNVTSQTWDLDSDGTIDFEDTDYPPNITFPTPGRNKITFCVNGEDNCVSKWVDVTGRLPAKVDRSPSFTTLAPNATNRKVTTSNIPLKVEARNVYNREDIIITVNDREINSYTFSEGLITGSVPVSQGENEIKIKALTNSGESTEIIRVQRGRDRVVASKPKKPATSRVRPPSVSLTTADYETTQFSAYDIRFTASNVSRDQITATVNGTAIPPSSVTLTGKSGVLRQVPLQMGMNNIVVTARNEGGSRKDTYKVKRIAAPSGPRVIAAVPDPPSDPTPPRSTPIPNPDPKPYVPPAPDVTRTITPPPPPPAEVPDPVVVDPDPPAVPARPAPTFVVVDPKPEPPISRPDPKPVTPPPPTRTVSSSGVDYFGVPVSNVNMASCTNFNVTNASMRISPKQPLVLMGGDVYSSGCGTLTVTLSTGKQSVSEYFELSEGQSSLTFTKLSEKELTSSIPYSITMKTGPSSNCEGNVPTLLDAKSCGKNNSGDNRIGLAYGANVSLFSIKYKY